MNKPTYVYVIGQVDQWGNAIPPLKVGITHNPKHRLFTFQSGSPVKLKILELFGFERREDAYRIEQEFHSRIAEDRVGCLSHGEWIGVGLDAVLEELDALIAELRLSYNPRLIG